MSRNGIMYGKRKEKDNKHEVVIGYRDCFRFPANAYIARFNVNISAETSCQPPRAAQVILIYGEGKNSKNYES